MSAPLNSDGDAPPATGDLFEFAGHSVDAAAGLITLRYTFAGGPVFCEELDFGTSFEGLPAQTRAAIDRAASVLHAIAGVSYYKLFAQERLDLGDLALSDFAREFIAQTYRSGLAEFAHRNSISLKHRLNFEGGRKLGAFVPTRTQNAAKSLVLIGGGKDSLVSLAAMQAAKADFALFAVNPRAPMIKAAEAAGVPLLSVKRSLDPQLFEWNERPETLNGHVPITAIVSLIATIAALVHGYGNIILSNERSADEPTLVSDGEAVNHQYSKSTQFEIDLAKLIAQDVDASLGYFSLLRPLSEAHIARLFAKRDDFDGIFTSCNRAFALRDRPDALWCGDCAKCRFTFLLLAPAMDKERLLAIFPHNLLDDPDQEQGYRDLMGIGLHKPWDCVGEERESALTLALLATNPDWRDMAIVKRLGAELSITPDALEAGLEEILTPANASLPGSFNDLILAYAKL